MATKTITVVNCDGCGKDFRPEAIRVFWIKVKTHSGHLITEELGEKKQGYMACPHCAIDLLGMRVKKEKDGFNVIRYKEEK